MIRPLSVAALCSVDYFLSTAVHPPIATNANTQKWDAFEHDLVFSKELLRPIGIRENFRYSMKIAARSLQKKASLLSICSMRGGEFHTIDASIYIGQPAYELHISSTHHSCIDPAMAGHTMDNDNRQTQGISRTHVEVSHEGWIEYVSTVAHGTHEMERKGRK